MLTREEREGFELEKLEKAMKRGKRLEAGTGVKFTTHSDRDTSTNFSERGWEEKRKQKVVGT